MSILNDYTEIPVDLDLLNRLVEENCRALGHVYPEQPFRYVEKAQKYLQQQRTLFNNGAADIRRSRLMQAAANGQKTAKCLGCKDELVPIRRGRVWCNHCRDRLAKWRDKTTSSISAPVPTHPFLEYFLPLVTHRIHRRVRCPTCDKLWETIGENPICPKCWEQLPDYCPERFMFTPSFDPHPCYCGRAFLWTTLEKYCSECRSYSIRQRNPKESVNSKPKPEHSRRRTVSTKSVDALTNIYYSYKATHESFTYIFPNPDDFIRWYNSEVTMMFKAVVSNNAVAVLLKRTNKTLSKIELKTMSTQEILDAVWVDFATDEINMPEEASLGRRDKIIAKFYNGKQLYGTVFTKLFPDVRAFRTFYLLPTRLAYTTLVKRQAYLKELIEHASVILNNARATMSTAELWNRLEWVPWMLIALTENKSITCLQRSKWKPFSLIDSQFEQMLIQAPRSDISAMLQQCKDTAEQQGYQVDIQLDKDKRVFKVTGVKNASIK